MREVLPTRRENVTIGMDWNNQHFDITASFYPDGRTAEAFIAYPKVGSEVQALSRDGAIILSLALQYGCPLSDISHSLTRDESGGPASLLGAFLDVVATEADSHKKEPELNLSPGS